MQKDSEKVTYMFSNLIGFLETAIIEGTASQEENTLYEDYKLFGTIDKKSYTYKNLVHKYLKAIIKSKICIKVIRGEFIERKKDGLNKQVHIYSIDTSAFYNDQENKLHNKILKSYRYRDHLRKLEHVDKKHKKYITQRIISLKEKLYNAFNDHNQIRTLRTDSLKDNNVISLFDSVLTRTLGIKENSLSEEIMVVQTYHFQILRDIIDKGFIHNNEKYVYFTSSAGQIRTKNLVLSNKAP